MVTKRKRGILRARSIVHCSKSKVVSKHARNDMPMMKEGEKKRERKREKKREKKREREKEREREREREGGREREREG